MSKKGRTEKPFIRVEPQDLGDMGKAELLEVQWQVGDKPSLDTTVKVKPCQQQFSHAEVRNLSCRNNGQ